MTEISIHQKDMQQLLLSACLLIEEVNKDLFHTASLIQAREKLKKQIHIMGRLYKITPEGWSWELMTEYFPFDVDKGR